MGIGGLLLFFAAHALLIRPVWHILAQGAWLTVPAGVAVGWAWHELHARRVFAARGIHGFAFGVLLWWLQVPLVLLAYVQGPAVPRPQGFGEAYPYVLESLVVGVVGLFVGAWIGAAWRPAVALGAAGAALGALAGPQVLVVGLTGRSLRIVLALLVVDAAAGVGFVALCRRLVRRRRRGA